MDLVLILNAKNAMMKKNPVINQKEIWIWKIKN